MVRCPQILNWCDWWDSFIFLCYLRAQTLQLSEDLLTFFRWQVREHDFAGCCWGLKINANWVNEFVLHGFSLHVAGGCSDADACWRWHCCNAQGFHLWRGNLISLLSSKFSNQNMWNMQVFLLKTCSAFMIRSFRFLLHGCCLPSLLRIFRARCKINALGLFNYSMATVSNSVWLWR